MSKFWKWFLSIVLVCCVVAGLAFGVWHYLDWYVNERPVEFSDGKSELILFVEEGTTPKEIMEQVNKAAESKVNSLIALKAFEHFKADRHILPGRYRMIAGAPLYNMIDDIKEGRRIMARYTVVEGIRTDNFLSRVQSDSDFKVPAVPLTPEEVMAEIGKPGVFPEGQFAADTYIFPAGDPVVKTLEQAYKEQQKRLKHAWENRDPNIAVKSPYELLILASIIEKETGNDKDRFKISSVFNNRLKKGMRLQTDPTVIYGIENFQGKILRSHLQADHPYNTYMHAGLPPTPIAIPGKKAIEAAAHPDSTEYLYFVSKADGTGESYFSKTLKEHNEAVQKYLRSQGK